MKRSIKRVTSCTGLDHFQQLDRLFIRQKPTGGGPTRFQVFTEGEQLLFNLHEAPFPLPGVVVDARVRSFRMDVFDKQQNELFAFYRPRTFGLGSDVMDIVMGGRKVAEVQRDVSIRPVFDISSPAEEIVYKIRGDMRHKNFEIQTANGAVLGTISKKFSGLLKAMFTSCDDYIITFPPGCSLENRAAIIGACIFIDFKYHEG